MRYIHSFNGWFGEIAKDVTYDKVHEIADTLSRYYKKNSSPGQKLVIGYDTRFFAKELAEQIATIMAKRGVKVFLSNRPAPSSVCIISALHKKSLGTIVITGDEYNAKFLGLRAYNMQGHFLTEEDILPFTEENNQSKNSNQTSINEYMKKGIIELFDTSIVYELFVHKQIDFKLMTPAINQLLFNPFYGSGMFYFDYFFQNQKLIDGVTIDSARFSDFRLQEPNPRILQNFMYKEMEEENLQLGFVISPDCTSFEFLVGNECLSKKDILNFLVEVLTVNDSPLNILISDDNVIDNEVLENVNITLVSAKDFHKTLKTNNYDLAMDNFERFYFKHHGAPDALLCGFYLFMFFNRKNVVEENASVYLKKIRNHLF